MSWISSKYAGKCRKCGQGHAVGERVWWERGSKGVECSRCHETGMSAPNPGNPVPTATSTVPGAPVAPTSTPGCPLPEDVGKSGNVVRVWDSFAAYVDTARECVNYGSVFRNDSKKDFYGNTPTYESALAMADSGYAEVRPEVDALVAKMETKIEPMLQPAFTSYFDVSGGSVDIARYLDGEPECMVETRLVEIAKPGRVITILVSGGYLGRAKVEDILARGAAIVGLCDSLQRLAHETEIWMEKSSSNGGKATLTHLVKLKNAGEPINVDMLMYAIAHPSCHRRLTFAIREQEPNGERFGIVRGRDCVGGTVEMVMAEKVGANVVLESVANMTETMNGEEWISRKLSEFGLLKEGE